MGSNKCIIYNDKTDERYVIHNDKGSNNSLISTIILSSFQINKPRAFKSYSMIANISVMVLATKTYKDINVAINTFNNLINRKSYNTFIALTKKVDKDCKQKSGRTFFEAIYTITNTEKKQVEISLEDLNYIHQVLNGLCAKMTGRSILEIICSITYLEEWKHKSPLRFYTIRDNCFNVIDNGIVTVLRDYPVFTSIKQIDNTVSRTHNEVDTELKRHLSLFEFIRSKDTISLNSLYNFTFQWSKHNAKKLIALGLTIILVMFIIIYFKG